MRDRFNSSQTPPTLASRARARVLLAPCLAAAVAACGGPDQAEPAAAGQPTAVPGSAQQAQSEAGAVSFTAVALQTSQIPDTVAAEHGIEQRDDLVMLRVSPRRGEPGSIESVPMEVQALVTNLSGDTTILDLEPKTVEGLVDYVATTEVTLPATLRFEITATTPQGERENLEITREFRAR